MSYLLALVKENLIFKNFSNTFFHIQVLKSLCEPCIKLFSDAYYGGNNGNKSFYILIFIYKLTQKSNNTYTYIVDNSTTIQ